MSSSPFHPARLTVFCGSRAGERPSYSAAARAMAEEMVRRDLGLVYGGGRVGLMGIVADTVLERGGHVIGIIPRALATREVAHFGLSELYVVNTMHERKAMMTTLAGGFVTLPGGLGTLEELFELTSLLALGYHQKPIGLLDVDGFYAPLLELLDRLVSEGFLAAEHRALFLCASTPAGLLDAMGAWTAGFSPPGA